ncbi:MAG: glycosyltransferase [Planctomycetaceae bacterium]
MLLPVYEAVPELLRQAIASVVAQTIGDWELLVVEDASEHSASDVLMEFSDPRIRHVKNSARTSFAAQLNRGLAEARAEWVARMDADDICEPHRLETQLAFLAANDSIDVLGSQLAVIDAAGRDIGFRRYPEPHDEIVAALKRFCPLAHPAAIFRRQTILAAGGYDDETDETVADYDLWCRLAKQGTRFANHREALLKYRIHSGSTKSAKLRQMLRGTLDVKRRHWNGTFDAWSRLRLPAEQAMLCVPPCLVLWLFRVTHLRSSLPPSFETNSSSGDAPKSLR